MNTKVSGTLANISAGQLQKAYWPILCKLLISYIISADFYQPIISTKRWTNESIALLISAEKNEHVLFGRLLWVDRKVG